MSVFFEQQNCMVHKRGIIPDSLCSVSFVRSTNTCVRLSEYYAKNNSLFFIPSGSEVDVQVGADAETVYFKFNQAQFIKRARAISPQNWEKPLSNALIFESTLRKPLELFSQYLYLHPTFSLNSEVTDANSLPSLMVMDKLLLALNSSSNNHNISHDLAARRRAKGRVNAALAYIEATISNGACPSIVDICIEMNISERNLQYCFKKILDISPNSYIYHLRLNRARLQLRKPNTTELTVTQVATNLQFWHLGRFANDYFRLFGELPSTTLFTALNKKYCFDSKSSNTNHIKDQFKPSLIL